jgi:hypothetical protein
MQALYELETDRLSFLMVLFLSIACAATSFYDVHLLLRF